MAAQFRTGCSNSKSLASLVCLLAFALVLLHQQQVAGIPVENNDSQKQQPEPLNPQDDSLSSFLVGVDCGPDEVLAAGKLPECEPTCADPKPKCDKIFYMDYTFCFCKHPLVRDTRSKRCVKLEECPK